MAQVTDDLRSRAPLRRKLVYAAAGVVLGAAATSFVYMAYMSASDEPPIWVKGGSISIELVHKTNKWEKQDAASSKKWKIKNGNRGGTDYQLVIATSKPNKCTSLTPSGPTVKVSYSDGTTIEFSIANGKASLNSSNDLQSSGDRMLTYDVGGQGHIARIDVGSASCDFSSEQDPQVAFVLLDK